MKYFFTLFLFILLSQKIVFGGQNNWIGRCGNTSLFLKRQNVIDSMVLKLKYSPYTLFVKNQLINNFGTVGIENLVRYTEPVVSDIFSKLILSDNFYIEFKAIYGIKNCMAVSNSKILAELFESSTNLLIKDMVVSTIGELRDSRLLQDLKLWFGTEKNEYLKHTIKYAIDVIEGKYRLIFPDFKYYLTSVEPYKYKYYKSGDKISEYKEVYSKIYLPEKHFPIAKKFIPPIIDYYSELIFKGKRISFGVGDKIKHTGDDCGWFREGSSVYAVGNGIIRLIHHSPDWGFLIVIEHKLKSGDYVCSVYGHLSHLIYKHAGDVVLKGEKIGEIGLSYSVDNGGYGAHLHFGISKGRWLKTKYDYAKNLSMSIAGKPQKVKSYKFVKKGIELIFENGTKMTLMENTKDFNQYFFWLKGYQFSKDIDRYWLNPRKFLSEYK